jgi:hypothetical protein
VSRDSNIGMKGLGTSDGYGRSTMSVSGEVGYYGRGMKAVPRPRKGLRLAYGMRRHAKTIGLLVVFIAAIAVLSAVAMGPSVKTAGISGSLPPIASFTATPNKLVVNVDATASSDPDGTIVSYDWNFGDGATASGVTAGHTYATWGTWWITLTVTDDDAMTGSMSSQVTVSNPSDPPPSPYNLLSMVTNSDASPALFAIVTITDLRTGAVWTAVTDDTYGYIQVDLLGSNETGFALGDTIQLDVISADGSTTGTNTGIASGGYLQVDVVLDTLIPEFPMVILPVIGMLAIAAVVSLKRRR